MNNFIEVQNKLINLDKVRDISFLIRTNDVSTVIFNFNKDESFTYKFPENERYKAKALKEDILGKYNVARTE